MATAASPSGAVFRNPRRYPRQVGGDGFDRGAVVVQCLEGGEKAGEGRRDGDGERQEEGPRGGGVCHQGQAEHQGALARAISTFPARKV